MKLKAVLSDRGLRLLEKGFLPTLEKFGKTVQILFHPEQVALVQTSLDADGVQIIARLDADVVFQADCYKCESKFGNRIGIALDLSPLARVLHGAACNAADAVTLQLTERMLPAADGQQVKKPCLTFSSRGATLHIAQDVPLIGRPYQREQVETLSNDVDADELCPYYIDVLPELLCLQVMVHNAKNIGSAARFLTTKAGEMHVQIRGLAVDLGMELRPLQVFGAGVSPNESMIEGETAEERLQIAFEKEDATTVVVQLKHIDKALHAAAITQPSRVLCGIAENNGYFHVMVVYNDPGSEGRPDYSLSLSLKLPVRDDDEL